MVLIDRDTLNQLVNVLALKTGVMSRNSVLIDKKEDWTGVCETKCL